jgi:radical SAM protein with 4Fe4S-binding SPASM domain
MRLAQSFFVKEHFSLPDSEGEKMSVFKRSVSNVVLEISSYCNRHCTYCPVSQVDRYTTNTALPEEIFNRVVSDLARIDYENGICLNLYNEPSADRDLLLSRIKAIRAAMPASRIYFSTNGDYLNLEYLQEMVEAGLSELYITLHTPKGKPYSDTYAIHRLTEISARLRKSVKITAFAPNQTLQGDISLFGIELHVFATNYDIFGSDRAGSVESLTVQATQRVAPCDRPFEDFTISYDGTVFPCCQMFVDNEAHKARFSIGNVMDYPSIFDIYASKAMASWRISLLKYGPKASPCDTCSEANVAGTQEQVAERQKIYKALVGDDKDLVAQGPKLKRIFRIFQKS